MTLGQYLQPTFKHVAVQVYVTPEKFGAYNEKIKRLGFIYVAAGPLVRSSYRAAELFKENVIAKNL